MPTHRYDIRTIKDEAEYMLGYEIADDEAKEIQWFTDYNKGASLEEIIQDYYACVQ